MPHEEMSIRAPPARSEDVGVARTERVAETCRRHRRSLISIFGLRDCAGKAGRMEEGRKQPGAHGVKSTRRKRSAQFPLHH